MRIDKDLVAASATPLVPAILDEDESYRYAIPKRVRELLDGGLEWTDAMLSPLVHRRHRLRHVTHEWRSAPEGRRRFITSTGDQRLRSGDRWPEDVAFTITDV